MKDPFLRCISRKEGLHLLQPFIKQENTYSSICKSAFPSSHVMSVARKMRDHLEGKKKKLLFRIGIINYCQHGGKKGRLKGKEERLEYIIETKENEDKVWVVVLILSGKYNITNVTGQTATISPGQFVSWGANGSSKIDVIPSKHVPSSLAVFYYFERNLFNQTVCNADNFNHVRDGFCTAGLTNNVDEQYSW